MAFPLTPDPSVVWNGESLSYRDIKAGRFSMNAPAFNMKAIVADATGLVPLVEPTTGLNSATRALICDAAGSIAGHDVYGNAITVYVQAGWNAYVLAGITSLTTTAHVIGVW